jgi:hypothetical protein
MRENQNKEEGRNTKKKRGMYEKNSGRSRD